MDKNFSIALVGNENVQEELQNYEYLLSTLYHSRYVFISNGSQTYSVYLQDPPFLILLKNESSVISCILNGIGGRQPIFLITSDTVSSKLRDSVIDFMKIINAELILDSETLIFKLPEHSYSSYYTWNGDFLASNSWVTWRSSRELTENNASIVITVDNESKSGTLSLFSDQNWTLNPTEYSVLELNSFSLSNASYQIFVETLYNEKIVLYDGSEIGKIYFNLLSLLSGKTVSSFYFYIRGNGTQFEISYLTFYSFK